MSTEARTVLEGFRSLPPSEQLAVYEAIARSVVPDGYGQLADEELTAIAAQSFELLDQEEAHARPR